MGNLMRGLCQSSFHTGSKRGVSWRAIDNEVGLRHYWNVRRQVGVWTASWTHLSFVQEPMLELVLLNSFAWSVLQLSYFFPLWNSLFHYDFCSSFAVSNTYSVVWLLMLAINCEQASLEYTCSFAALVSKTGRDIPPCLVERVSIDHSLRICVRL